MSPITSVHGGSWLNEPSEIRIYKKNKNKKQSQTKRQTERHTQKQTAKVKVRREERVLVIYKTNKGRTNKSMHVSIQHRQLTTANSAADTPKRCTKLKRV